MALSWCVKSVADDDSADYYIEYESSTHFGRQSFAVISDLVSGEDGKEEVEAGEMLWVVIDRVASS